MRQVKNMERTNAEETSVRSYTVNEEQKWSYVEFSNNLDTTTQHKLRKIEMDNDILAKRQKKACHVYPLGIQVNCIHRRGRPMHIKNGNVESGGFTWCR